MSSILKCISPIDGSVYAERPLMEKAAAFAAVKRAEDAQAAWAMRSLGERVVIVRDAVARIGEMNDEIVPELAWQMGRPVRYGGEFGGFTERASYMADIAAKALAPIEIEDSERFTRYIKRVPHGIILVIAPWNYPYMTAINTVAPALIAGNAVMLKHASQTPLVGERLAKAFQATVFATARTEEKCAVMRRFGADHVINYREQIFDDVCRAETDGRGIDVIVDIVGGDYLPKEVALLAHGGRLVIINLPAGKIAQVDFGHVHARHLTITGSRMRPRSVADKSKICRALEQRVWPLFETGEICTETCAVFLFAQAADAHRLMESSNHIGKIILTP